MTPATRVIDVVCDASIVLKWFHSEDEPEVHEARTLLAAHRAGRVTASILDVTLYELGNVLLRSLGWPAAQVAAQLDDLQDICAVIAPTAADLRLAAELAEAHALTFYDAAYAAVAQERGAALATADRDLLRAGAGEAAGALVARLGLTGTI